MKKKIITLLSSLLLLLAFVYYFVPDEQINEYAKLQYYMLFDTQE